MVEMGGLFSTIIESIAPKQDKKSLKAILVPQGASVKCTPCRTLDKVYGKNVSIYFCLTSDRFFVFHGYNRLTRLGPLLSVGLEVGINHDSFEHHIQA